MPQGSRLLAIGLAVAALIVVPAWRFEARQVQHATLPVGEGVVELWRDPVDAELAFRFQGTDSC
jgi:hypothetical protein